MKEWDMDEMGGDSRVSIWDMFSTVAVVVGSAAAMTVTIVNAMTKNSGDVTKKPVKIEHVDSKAGAVLGAAAVQANDTYYVAPKKDSAVNTFTR